MSQNMLKSGHAQGHLCYRPTGYNCELLYGQMRGEDTRRKCDTTLPQQ